MINKETFFDKIRDSLFGGHLTQDQVDGCEKILEYYEANPGICTIAQLAYLLATEYHETARTMQPIEEYGKGHGKPYGRPDPETHECYYGRGAVQLTWKYNYEFQDKKLGLDGKLVADPSLAMKYPYYLDILFKGSMDGDFTGKALVDYIHDDVIDFYNARLVINGHDRAKDIAGYAKQFLKALT